MRKEYDLKRLKVKRIGVLHELKDSNLHSIFYNEIKEELLQDKNFMFALKKQL